MFVLHTLLFSRFCLDLPLVVVPSQQKPSYHWFELVLGFLGVVCVVGVVSVVVVPKIRLVHYGFFAETKYCVCSLLLLFVCLFLPFLLFVLRIPSSS